MIRAAGGVPVLLPNTPDREDVERTFGMLDGLFLTGGEDVHPELYREPIQTETLKLSPQRDRYELQAIDEADRRELPILGICRGTQVLNVAYHGTLFQDLRELRTGATNDHTRGGDPFYRRFHDVVIERGTRLHDIVGQDRITVATSHHQAIKDAGRILRVTAYAAEDQVIEAVELPGDRFVVGVQWHPEVLPDDDATRRLAAAFVSAARIHA
jgi:putative glutamine amidotransferase